jgi:hypothetical protein
MSSRFQEGRWRDWYEANAMELSTFCLARGRYEVARELHAIGTECYEREVVNKAYRAIPSPSKNTTAKSLENTRNAWPSFHRWRLPDLGSFRV